MTQEDTAKALKLLTDTEALTGTDLSTVRWAVQRHADVMAAGQDAHTTRAEQRLVPGTNGPKEVER